MTHSQRKVGTRDVRRNLAAEAFMKRRQRVLALRGVAVVMLMAASTSSAYPQQPPGPDCRRVSKVEYDSAKSYFLLRTKFGAYLRTGHFWRPYYWYCRW
jgi:hypothetical protein